MKKTNIINKSTQQWITSQPCYYNEKYYIAEGYCDRQASLIYEGKYICRKCVSLLRKHKFFEYLLKIGLPLIFGGSAIIFYFSPWPIFCVFFVIFGGFWTLGNIGQDFLFKHEGKIESWNGFICQHCPERFLNKDTKLFIRHLKSKHLEKWKEIEKQIQQFPNNKKVVKIEFPEILKEYKKEISWREI